MDQLLHEYGVRAPVSRLKPTKEQQMKLDTVLSWAVSKQQFFAYLLMAHIPIILTEDVPIAGTDGFVVFLNPTVFFTDYALDEQAFIIFHEVLHCVFGDCLLGDKWRQSGQVLVDGKGTYLPYDDEMMNHADDYVINATLIKGNCGKYRSEWLYDPDLSLEGNDAAVTIYAKLWARRKPKGPDGSGRAPGPVGPGPYPGNPGGQKRFDEHLPPGASTGEDPEKAAKKRDPVVWEGAIAAAAQAAEMQGNLPASLKRLVGDILDPKVSWQDHIRASLNRISGSEGLDWTQPDRRMMSRGAVGHDPVFFARTSGFSCGTIVVGDDTSGSISDTQQTAFFREMAGIFADMNPSSLVIMDCDAEVHSVREIEDISELDDIRIEGVQGGGGTDFRPVFDKIAELGIEPDVLVYFTDMEGGFPDIAPAYPVIWACISPYVKTAPFGELVHVEV